MSRQNKLHEASHHATVIIDPSDPRPEQIDIEEQIAGEGLLIIKGVDVIPEFRAGVKIADLCHRTGVKRGKLRRQIQAALGGAKAYKEDRGAIVKRRETNTNTENRTLLDQDVPRIHNCRTDEGWRSKIIYVNYGGSYSDEAKKKGIPHDPRISESLLISPKGVLYVLAKTTERSDLIVDGLPQEYGLDPIRLRLFKTSSVFRLVNEHEALVAQGEKAHTARKERKRATKVRRKGGV